MINSYWFTVIILNLVFFNLTAQFNINFENDKNMFIPRDAEPKIRQLAQKFPVIAIVGPRQSGKTTLSRQIFSTHTHVSLEDFDVRQFAQQDPRGFFHTYSNESGIIIDEIQHVPELLSYNF